MRFDPAAPPPARFLAYLDRVMEGDGDRVRLLQEMAGACLDARGTEKWFGCLVGEGENGKSVFLAVLRALLGEANVSAVGLDQLAGHRFAAHGLHGKLANLVGDQGYVETRDEGRLKALTGGDKVPLEAKGKQPFFAVNTAKIILACNTLPRFTDRTDAVWNRLQVVPFRVRIGPAERDPRLLDPGFWAGELPGILVWALEGLARLRANNGFTRAAVCEDMKREHRVDCNPARQFLTEQLEFTGAKGDFIPSGQIYQRYRDWGRENGHTQLLANNRFGREIARVYPQAVNDLSRWCGRSARGWHGVKYRHAATGPGPWAASEPAA